MHAYLPLEIWFIIAESFFSKASLRSLCLVSKDLNAICTPVLYKTVRLLCVRGNMREDGKLKGLSELDTETHLRFTRHLEIGKGWKSIKGVEISPSSLEGLLKKMTQIKSCKVWCVSSQLRNVYLAPVTDLALLYDMSNQVSVIPKASSFENLCSLDLRNLRGPMRDHAQDIARVLIRWPNLKLLGLDLDSRWYAPRNEFIIWVVSYFKHLREENGTPDLQLELQELILGRGTVDANTNVAPWHELTNLSKLRSLTILNEDREFWDGSRVFLNLRPFLEASNLKSLTVYFFDRHVVALIRALSCYGSLQEIEIRSIRDYKNPNFSWYRPITEVGGGWRKSLLGGRLFDVCPENFSKEVLDKLYSQSQDIEEIGLPYIRWDNIKPYLANFRHLRVLMAGYHKYIPDEWCLKCELVVKIIKAHRKAMKDQGLVSKLKYVGIGMSVYAVKYPILSARLKNQKPRRSDRHVSTRGLHKFNDYFEVVELEAEETNGFEFIKNLEKTNHR